MAYKKAFKCDKCPETNSVTGCPAWTELFETNVATGQERFTKGCLFALLPKMIVEVIKASNRPAAAMESTRNAVIERLSQLVKLLPNS